MPDRDFVSTHVRSPWRAAARLWEREGSSVEMVDRADRALAKVLREGGLLLDRARNEAERAGRDLTIDQRERRTLELLVCQAVFAPMRGLRMMSTDPSQVAAEEAKVLAALAPAIDRYVFAIAEGRPPRVSPRARPDLRRVLETPVQIQL